ncbi:hypothetical protein Q7P35_012471 [Cladosporium inversicolor]
MSRSQRTPSRAPSTASNNAALLGALMAFGGASKSNGDILRSRGNSPATPANSLRGRSPGLSPSSSYRQPATASASARVSPAAVVPTRPNATASTARNDINEDIKTQRPTPPPKPRRLSEHHYKPRPISPATSFIGILENKSSLRRPTPKQQHHPNEVSSVDMEVRAQAEAATTQSEGQERRQKDPAQRQKVEVRSGNSRPTSSADRRAQDRTRAQVEARLAEAQDRARSQGLSSSEDDEYVSASEDTARSPTIAPRAGTTAAIKQPPQPPPTRSRPPPPGPRRNLNNPSQLIEISPAPRASMSSARSMSPQSNPSLNAAYHQLYPRRTTQLTLGEDLANAMVASSLATSRASSPSKLAPPSTTPRRHNHLSPFGSRTPSPTKSTKKAKGMRHTLRDPESSSSESETEQHPYGKHKKKRHLRPKHPNKHHEGDRKRWRDAVTERERKRYEGLYASNRGLLLPSEMSDEIANVVVRDLWLRSRLPLGELESIWNLVIAGEPEQPAIRKTSLNREEFVVGLWLIDQRLKGRKLPVKVSETVWTSVRGLQGIKIKKFRG